MSRVTAMLRGPLTTATPSTMSPRSGRMRWATPTTAPISTNNTTPAALAAMAMTGPIHHAARSTPVCMAPTAKPTTL